MKRERIALVICLSTEIPLEFDCKNGGSSGF